MTKKIITTFSFLIIFIIGFILRYYNYSYDDLWYDEIISFWVANPYISLKETLNNNSLIEVNFFTYNLILKYFYLYFGYNVESGRFLSVLFSSLSIITIAYLSWQNKKNLFFLFSSFLISLNIFLITFAQEMRVYSILFFFASLSLIFFIKNLNENKNLKNIFIFNFINLIYLSLHPFSFIIFFSYIIYLFLIFNKHKKIYIYLNISIIINFLFYLFFAYINFINIFENSNLISKYFWWENPTLKFYTNFYFSSFFGSRLMGIIFLVLFIGIIIKNYKKFISLDYLSLFFLIFIFSYLLPISYGYIFNPIISNKYIIFVLIPIILLISLFIFEIKNNKMKILLIIFISLITIGNHFTEQTFKQFFKTRQLHKPEYTAALHFINKSNFKYYTLLVEKMKNNDATINAINHYINYINKNNNLNIQYISQRDITKGQLFWYICFQDINEKSCTVKGNINQFNIVEEKDFNNINLKLLKIY